MNKILKAIQCPFCKEILRNPVLLTCSHSVCKEHVDHAIANRQEIRCAKCGVENWIPNVGFIHNEALQEIIETEINKSTLVAQFNLMYETFANLKDYAILVENMIRTPQNLIDIEINEMKHNVVVAGEEFKNKIDNDIDSIFKKLEDYRNRYLTDDNTFALQYVDDLRRFDSEIKDVKRNLDELEQNFNNFDFSINQSNLKKIKDNNVNLIEKLNVELEALKKKIFPADIFDDIADHIEVFKNLKIEDYIIRIDSYILNNVLFVKLKRLFYPLKLSYKAKLLYRGSRDGFSAAAFHEKCNGIHDTLTVIKTANGRVFGGYARQPWYSLQDTYHIDQAAFIYSLVNGLNKPVKFKPKNREISKTLYQDADCGPTFGEGHDLMISDNSDANLRSYTKLGNTYQVPGFIVTDPYTFLAGSRQFVVSEIEVHQVDFIGE